MAWHAVCDCGISWIYLLTLCNYSCQGREREVDGEGESQYENTGWIDRCILVCVCGGGGDIQTYQCIYK